MPKSKPQAEHKEQSEAILKKACKVNRGVWSWHFFFKSLPSLPCTTEFKRPWIFFRSLGVAFSSFGSTVHAPAKPWGKEGTGKVDKSAHGQQNRHSRQHRVNVKTAKECSVPVEQGLCKAGRKAPFAALQRGIWCQCQCLLSNTHCPSQWGPSLPTCTWCTHLTACERSVFMLQKINLKETLNKYK